MSFEKMLLQAAATGDLEKIKEALDSGANINATNEKGSTALLLAVLKAHKQAVILLCEQGADPTVVMPNSGTCLMIAALFSSDKTIVEVLMQTKKVSFEASSHELAFRGHLAKLQKALDNIPCQDSYQNNELHYAAANGQQEVIIWLVQQGFSLIEKNQHGITPLLMAAFNGHLATVQWLLQNGASLRENDNNGNTALLMAAGKGHLATIQWLLQNGASLRENDNNGNTALLMAAAKGHLATVQWLLQNGASLRENDNNGNTALLMAAAKGHPATVQWLLQNGASLQEKNNDGNTALLIAAKDGHLATIQWLLQNGASLQEKNNYGGTVLLIAAGDGHLGIVQWLLQNGASLQEKNNYGNTALLMAVNYNNLPIVQWLLTQTTQPIFEKNKRGMTALSHALKKNWQPVIHELLKAGAAIGQSVTSVPSLESSFMDGKVVIGLMINGVRVTRKTPGYEKAITTLEELHTNANKITNHFQLIKVCHEYLQTNKDKEIQTLQRKLMLLSGNGLIYLSSMFIANNQELKKKWADVNSQASLDHLSDIINQLNQVRNLVK